jgi:hypothetical protein
MRRIAAVHDGAGKIVEACRGIVGSGQGLYQSSWSVTHRAFPTRR